MTSLGSVDTPHIEGRYAVDSRYPRTQKPVTKYKSARAGKG